MPCDLPFDVRTRGRAKFDPLRKIVQEAFYQTVYYTNPHKPECGVDMAQAAADLQTELEDILERLG